MAKLPDKFEDWTPPWKDGEFDADRAARLVFNAEKNLERTKDRNAVLSAENQELKDKVDDFEHAAPKGDGSKSADQKDQEIRELQKQVRTLERDGRAEDKSLIERLEVAIEHGLTANDARRLVGKDRDELDADAKDLATRLGITNGDEPDGDQGGAGGDAGGFQGGVVPVSRLKNGGGATPPKVLSVEELLKQDDSTAGRTLLPQR